MFDVGESSTRHAEAEVEEDEQENEEGKDSHEQEEEEEKRREDDLGRLTTQVTGRHGRRVAARPPPTLRPTPKQL